MSFIVENLAIIYIVVKYNSIKFDLYDDISQAKDVSGAMQYFDAARYGSNIFRIYKHLFATYIVFGCPCNENTCSLLILMPHDMVAIFSAFISNCSLRTSHYVVVATRTHARYYFQCVMEALL